MCAQAARCRRHEQTGGSETASIERLLDQLEATASRWVEAEYQEGIATGRHGVKSWIAVMRPIQASI